MFALRAKFGAFFESPTSPATLENAGNPSKSTAPYLPLNQLPPSLISRFPQWLTRQPSHLTPQRHRRYFPATFSRPNQPHASSVQAEAPQLPGPSLSNLPLFVSFVASVAHSRRCGGGINSYKSPCLAIQVRLKLGSPKKPGRNAPCRRPLNPRQRA